MVAKLDSFYIKQHHFKLPCPVLKFGWWPTTLGITDVLKDLNLKVFTEDTKNGRLDDGKYSYSNRVL